MRRTSGTTLFELLVALTFISVILSLALPGMRSGLDALAARAARETAFALFSRARFIAVQNGGARIELHADDDRIVVRSARGVEYEQAFPTADLILDGARDSATLRYDGHGLGRMMSRTLSFRVNQATAGLTISSFGRVRRW